MHGRAQTALHLCYTQVHHRAARPTPLSSGQSCRGALQASAVGGLINPRTRASADTPSPRASARRRPGRLCGREFRCEPQRWGRAGRSPRRPDRRRPPTPRAHPWRLDRTDGPGWQRQRHRRTPLPAAACRQLCGRNQQPGSAQAAHAERVRLVRAKNSDAGHGCQLRRVGRREQEERTQLSQKRRGGEPAAHARAK
eukprot:scaffold12967_cov120-Isochrysis_galbana.AAC.3